MQVYDVIIAGGGPAGLNAAIVLARSRRKVIVFDSGHQRNIRSHGMHNYLTRDGIKPVDFLQLATEEARRYRILIKKIEVKSAFKNKTGYFEVEDVKGNVYHAKKILLATGLSDNLPKIEGFDELYGKYVFHCPYCDGWEVRDKRLAVYAHSKNGVDLALSLKTWSEQVTLYTDGRKYLKPSELALLEQYEIPIITEKIKRLQIANDKLKSVVLKDDSAHLCDALFFVNGYTQQCALAERLGCTINSKRVVITNRLQQTNVPGVFVAGDASRDMHFVVVAAAEGAKAGVSINKELQSEEKRAVAKKLHKKFA